MSRMWTQATVDLICAIRVQPMQADEPLDPDVIYQAIRHADDAGVLLVDGVPIAARMLLPQWPGRQCLYVLMSADAGPYMARIVRQVREWVERFGDRRVEATVRSGWGAGRRFALLLGFSFEGRMECYDRKGRAHDLWARVR
jgi:hypothetical protein